VLRVDDAAVSWPWESLVISARHGAVGRERGRSGVLERVSLRRDRSVFRDGGERAADAPRIYEWDAKIELRWGGLTKDRRLDANPRFSLAVSSNANEFRLKTALFTKSIGDGIAERLRQPVN
jgi:hypothetical protein